MDPIGITSVFCKHVGPRSGPTKSRALGRRKVGPDLDPNCLTLLELMKLADDTVRYSITAFCHVCHLYTRAISALKFEAFEV